ncbi:MAG: PAS domain-containing protein [Myxococcales bacterium]|nr:PAS domain-containing protein [Myxococcales bacterium]MCB9577038.1 PAS domain-containing protein [Polyangiaceae bacterium]
MPSRDSYAAIDAIPAAVVLSERTTGRVVYANEHAARTLRASVSQLLGRRVHEVYAHPDDQKALMERIQTEGAFLDHEIELVRDDGTHFWALASCKPLEDDPELLCGTFVPIAEGTRQRRQRLEETERRLSTVLDNLPGLAYRCRNDAQWTMEFISAGCERLTGYRADELTGNRVLSYGTLILEEDQERVWEAVQRALTHHEPYQLEYRIVTKSGALRWVWEQGVGIWNGPAGSPEDVVALEGIVHDVTERHHAEQEREDMEQQMRAAQRLEAIGRLAGGVAHDFNNILTVIRSYADFLQEELREGDPARDDAREIAEAADRAAHLTSQLLAFSRRQIQALAVVELNSIVSGLENMLGRLIGEDITLVTRLAAEPSRVRVDVSQVEQVILNLAVNARDAMPSGGRLSLETANVTLEETYGANKDVKVPPGRYVMLAVSDTGTGIPEDVKSNIFEPFFTTKEAGKGTGLGLSTVYGIVKQSGGYVWVYTEVDRGTVFKIYLPLAEGEAAVDTAGGAGPRSGQGTESILLVEDERTVRRAAARILKKQGYSVLEAANGSEALAFCRREAPIDLVLTDIVMPDLSGKDLASVVKEIRPDVRVVYMSGYTEGTISHHAELGAGDAFLQKPFSSAALLEKIRSVLDAS